MSNEPARLPLEELLRNHLERYPLMCPEDVYKLLFQAYMGPSHAVPDTTVARDRLLSEISTLQDGPGEPLIDPVGISSDLARVHIRPWIQAKLDPSILADAFTGTADVFVQEKEALIESLMAPLVRSVTDGEEMGKLLKRAAETGYPAMHHSRQFNAAYRPAYRLVSTGLLPVELVIGSKS